MRRVFIPTPPMGGTAAEYVVSYSARVVGGGEALSLNVLRPTARKADRPGSL